MEDKFLAVYNGLRQKNPDMPDYNKFKSDLQQNEQAREVVYNGLKKNNPDMPDFETFSKDMGFVGSPVQQQKEEVGAEQGKKGFWDSYIGDTIEKIGAGASRFGASMYSALEHFNNSVLKPWDLSSVRKEEDLSDVPELKIWFDKLGVSENERRLTDGRSWLKRQADNAYQYADVLRERSDRYKGENFYDLLKKGDYSGAVGDVFLQASESLPQSLAAMFGGAAGLALTGVSAGTQKYDELDKMPETKDLPEYQKVINAVSSGTFEALSEKFGDVPIGNWIKGLYSKLGVRAGEEAVKNGFQQFLSNSFKKYGVLLAPVSEGVEEIASQIAENATDYFTGVSDNPNLLDGTLESFVYGAAGGAQFVPVAGIGMVKQRRDRRRVNRDFNASVNAVRDAFPNGKADDFIDGIYSLSRNEQEEIIQNMLNDSGLNDAQRDALINLYSVIDVHRAYNSPEARQREKFLGQFEKFRNKKNGDIVTARDSDNNPVYVLDETDRGYLVMRNDGSKEFLPISELRDVVSESLDEHVNAFMRDYLNIGKTNEGVANIEKPGEIDGSETVQMPVDGALRYQGRPIQVVEGTEQEDGSVVVEDDNGETMRVPAGELETDGVPVEESVRESERSEDVPDGKNDKMYLNDKQVERIENLEDGKVRVTDVDGYSVVVDEEEVEGYDEYGNRINSDSGASVNLVEDEEGNVERVNMEDDNSVSSVVAGDYLMNSGINSIKSSDYFFKALAGVFRNATNEIEAIRTKYKDEIINGGNGFIDKFKDTEIWDNIINEVKQVVVSKYRNNSDILSAFDKIVSYPTGLPVRLGSELQNQIESIEERDIQSKVPMKEDGTPDYDAMSPDMFAEEFEREFGADAARSELEQMVSDIDAQVEKLRKKSPTNRNERAGNMREIARLNSEREVVLKTLERYGVREDATQEKVQEERPVFSNEEEAVRWVMENSEDVGEVLGTYESVKELQGDATLPRWQQELQGIRINPESFYKEGDRNLATPELKRGWLSKGGRNIDEVAHDLSNYGVEVAPQDVVDFMLEHPSGKVRQRSSELDELGRRFSELATKAAGVKIGKPDSPTGKLFIENMRTSNDMEQLRSQIEDAQRGEEEALRSMAEQRDAERENISDDVDENGRPFVMSSKGSTVFGEIREDSGLPPAPIKLSEGYQDENGKGYGLAHIEANHGEQIRKSGFDSVEDFVSYVAENYDENNIRVGKRRNKVSPTYLIQVVDSHDNTLFIELSGDGSYWNVNSAGIFRKGYSNKKETVAKTEPQQPNNAVSSGSSLSMDEKNGITPSEPNSEPTVSAVKDTESFSENQDDLFEKIYDEADRLEDSWNERILDYIYEHYPTQATVSAETKSPKGMAEREAMRNDEELKRMKEQAKSEIDAAFKKADAAFNKAMESDSPLFRGVYGGNSGYVGYSMSRRAASARENGRFPKTDFKKEYGITDKSLDALTKLGLIDNSEWHHTSKYGNKTPFFGWQDEASVDAYQQNKKEIDRLSREYADYMGKALGNGKPDFLAEWEMKSPNMERISNNVLTDLQYSVFKKKSLTDEEKAEFKARHDEVSQSGLPIEERRAKHREIDEEEVNLTREREAKIMEQLRDTEEYRDAMKDVEDRIENFKQAQAKLKEIESLMNQEANESTRFRNGESGKEISSFAEKYGFDENDVKKYSQSMRQGNLGGASFAIANMRRKVRLDNVGKSLGEFVKIFEPIKAELYEKFGNVDALRDEQVQMAMEERNVMEAARKRAEEEAEAERKRLEEFEMMSDEQLDNEYFKAIENNDEGRMRDLVNEAARRRGYVSSDEFRMAHRAPSYDEEGYDKSMVDVANNKDDIRESLNEQLRMNRDRNMDESAKAIEKALSAIDRGEKPTVTIYRAVPKSLKEGKVRNGDWVTLSESYAKQHGNHALEGDYRIMSEEVPAENLYWDGNDINEWGYDDRSDYRYRNTRNNRKLNDLITRDDDGNVIPLSQRFNARNSDARFRENDEYTPEEQEIIDQAKKDGSYMKAPNGKPSNLNEKQWAQVRTKAFKDWFGDWENDPKNASKVVDENGEPLVVYHNTPKEFTVFDPYKSYPKNSGFWFSEEPFSHYGDRLVKAFLNLRNPKYGTVPYDMQQNVRNWRGLVLDGETEKGERYRFYIAGLPDQIKSATDNVGTFSRSNDDIRFNENGDVSIEDVNRRFNEELEQQINGELPKGHVYQLGKPSDFLRRAGIPDLPIEMPASQLAYKSTSGKHDYDLSEVMNLPEAIANPIATFSYGDKEKSQNILTVLEHNGENFLVGMFIRPTAKGKVLEVNSIRNVFPKNGDSIVKWILNGKLTNENKEKLLNFLDQQRTNYADVASVLPVEQVKQRISEVSTATKIVKNFENPTLEDGKIVSAVESLAAELNVPVRIVRNVDEIEDKDSKMQRKKRGSKGWYDPKTGEIVVVLPNASDVRDAKATVLHEIVGHKGIRGLFGDKIGEFTKRVLDSMPEAEREKWVEKYGGNEQLAAEEYVAQFAEGYENPGMWDKIVAIVRDLLRDLGIDLKLSDADLKYTLWRGVRRMQEGATLTETAEFVARDREVRRNLFREDEEDDGFADRHLNLSERAREEFQDRMLSVKMLLDEVRSRGGEVMDYANPYIAENLATSKSKAQIDDFNDRLWSPIMEYVKAFSDKGKSREDVDRYMMAKHAPERNALLMEREGVEYGSGMTDADAQVVVDEFEKDFSADEIGAFWDAVRDATRFTTETWQKHGLIDKATKDYYDGMYRYYVPLRGWEKSDADNIEYLDGSRRGGSVNVNKKAKGRSSIADSPLAYIASMAHSAIVAGNKNDVKRNVFEMMALNKNPDLYHLKKVYQVNTGTKDSPIWVEQLEKPAAELWNEGRVKVDVDKSNEAKREFYKTKQHQVEVFVNGQKYVMEFNGNMGVQVANAINGLNVRHSELLQNSIGRVTRWLSANYTSKNPEFMVTNFLRDFGYAIPAYWMNGGNAKVLMSNMPKAFQAIHNDVSGKKVDSELQKMYDEFKMNGGLTGYVHLTDIESYKKRIERDIRRMSGDRTLGDVVLRNKAMRAGAFLLDYLAEMSENSTRFAVYMSERQAGKSATQAAYAAKEITTNFNRKGRSSAILGSMYGFFNATVQGTANALGLAKRSPGKFAVYCGTMIMIQYLASSLCRMFGGDDEVGENNYDRLADWVKYNNLVLPDPANDGRFVTIPLPHFFRALSSLGVIAGEVANGVKTAGNGMEAMFDAVAGDLTPVEIATPQFKNLPSFLMSVTPTGLKPITEAYAFNRNFMNLPIAREAMGDQKKTLPQHQLAKKTTNPVLVSVSKWLNEAGGGGKFTTAEIGFDKETGDVGRNDWKTWMDVNPAKFEHVVEGIFGGRLKFFNNVYKTVDNVLKGEFEPLTTPIVRPLYQSPKGESAWIKFYEVRDDVVDIDAKASEFMKTGSYDAYGLINYRNARLVETFKAYDSALSALNDALKVVTDAEQAEEIERKRDEVVKEFAIEYKKLEAELRREKSAVPVD